MSSKHLQRVEKSWRYFNQLSHLQLNIIYSQLYLAMCKIANLVRYIFLATLLTCKFISGTCMITNIIIKTPPLNTPAVWKLITGREERKIFSLYCNFGCVFIKLWSIQATDVVVCVSGGLMCNRLLHIKSYNYVKKGVLALWLSVTVNWNRYLLLTLFVPHNHSVF